MTIFKIALPLVILMAAACAPVNPSAPMQTQAAANAGPTMGNAPVNAPASAATSLWDVTAERCYELLAASDDDRAAAAMFYYGYHAANAAVRVIDDAKIDANIHRVIQVCARSPELSIARAFDVALARAP